MKKLLFALFFGAFFIPMEMTNAQTLTIPDHPDNVICRYRQGGCYGGNAFSFNSRCGTSGMATNGEFIDCGFWLSNCPPV